MTLDAAQFRTDFPEFTDTTAYPDSLINFWLALAGKLLNPLRWGDMLTAGQELFIAHNIVLEARAKLAADKGGIPGASLGVQSSKSVGPVSVSYDTASALEEGAGHWNLTIYGTRYIRLARMLGAGPVQVGAGGIGPNLSSAGAWPGPYTGPGFTNF